MREKYESLALIQLKELAKVRGLKGTSGMKKGELVEAMLAEDERLKREAAKEAAVKEAASESAPRSEAAPRSGNEAVPRNEAVSRRPRPQGGVKSNVRGERPERPEKSNAAPRAEYGGSESAGDAIPHSDNGMGDRQEQRAYRGNEVYDENQYPKELDSGEEASGILEVMPDGYGFIRCANYLPGENDVYVAPSQIRRFGLKTGDILRGNKRVKTQQEKFSALLFIRTINGYTTEESAKRMAFEDMTPIFPNERIKLEVPGCNVSMRVMDLVSPVGKGQRGMIVSPPKAGKTTLLKEVAKSVLRSNPNMHMLILLIDERPEEVTDIKEAIQGDLVEVIYSTFDELPEHHKRVSEMVIERAKRLVEHKKDVVILLDSITRLTRAYNQVVPPSGRTLSGGLDPSALHMPKRFFGAARNMREGGSLTILATALVDTGSKMDDVVYEEFKGTGNMEMVLDRKLSEKRIFPAIDLAKSSTRREDLLLSPDELDAINIMRKALNGLKPDEATDRILDMFARTRNNIEFVNLVKKNKFI
ncbi:MAG: transcription termination factor Rho [Candidatus Gastranaerophilales bacterium]|nr:transcription termination factor Rho [Candidatus Gastranaerophilales bacterium]